MCCFPLNLLFWISWAGLASLHPVALFGFTCHFVHIFIRWVFSTSLISVFFAVTVWGFLLHYEVCFAHIFWVPFAVSIWLLFVVLRYFGTLSRFNLGCLNWIFFAPPSKMLSAPPCPSPLPSLLHSNSLLVFFLRHLYSWGSFHPWSPWFPHRLRMNFPHYCHPIVSIITLSLSSYRFPFAFNAIVPSR